MNIMSANEGLVYDIINKVPDYKEFMTIEELYESSAKLAGMVM